MRGMGVNELCGKVKGTINGAVQNIYFPGARRVERAQGVWPLPVMKT